MEDKFSDCIQKKMAGAKGLEPSAFCVTGRRYNQLNYAPVEVVNENVDKI